MTKKVLLISFYTCFAALLAVFAIYDLNISIALTKYSGKFFELFEYYGEFPIYIFPLLFTATFFFLSNKKFNRAFCAIALLAIYTFMGTRVLHNKHIDYNALNLSICLAIGILLSLITLFGFSKIKIETLNNIKDIAFYGLVVSICSFLFVWVLKNIWGRVRFRDLSSDYKEFTRVYILNGPTGNESFPSGHTNAAASALIIPLLVARLTNKKWAKYLSLGLCLTYIVVLAVSRILVGAHYASDVLCGFTASFSIQQILYYVMKRKGVINVASNKC